MANMEIFGKLEFPTSDIVFDKILTIEGWTFSSNDFVQIDILVDKIKIDTIDPGWPRFDIYQKFGTEKSYESGFFYHILRGKLIKQGINLDKENFDLEIVSRTITSSKTIGHTIVQINSDVSKIPKPETFYNIFSKGKLFFPKLVELGKLESDQTVLDVGCGMGRVAMTLTKFLTHGEYYGFDIVPSAIKKCQSNITPKYPHFHFELVDVSNTYYNKDGKNEAKNFQFPYDDDKFDLVFLQSVFTHLFPHDIENYLNEIKRVLKKGKRSVITYYLINETSKNGILKNKIPPAYRFTHDRGNYYLAFADNPEAAIAHDESFIRDVYQKVGMTIETIKYGNWNGNIKSDYYSDIVVSVK